MQAEKEAIESAFHTVQNFLFNNRFNASYHLTDACQAAVIALRKVMDVEFEEMRRWELRKARAAAWAPIAPESD